jgi:hypothetical protein
MNCKIVVLASLMAMASMIGVSAKVSLPSIISDNMVLQQESDARLWGTASPGETVKVSTSWSKASVSVKAGTDGRWECTVATPAASYTPQQITIKGKNTIKLSNVLIGEVWLCSGQSNMEFPVGPHKQGRPWRTGMVDYEEQLRDADYPAMRLFTVPYCVSPDTLKTDCDAAWLACTPESAFDFSAVAFVFGRRLAKDLQIPIGLIHVSRGDTHVESWLKAEIMKDDPYYAEVYDAFGADKVEISKKPHKIPSCLWNGMINPILGYNVRGTIWYQGEANAMRSDKYQQVFTTLIDSWRQEWHNPDMPFYFVQIAPFHKQPAAIREAQLDTWKSGIKNLGMVVLADCGDSLDIHPRNKVIPGERLARWALAKDYGRNVAYCGPIYKAMECTGNAVELTFDYAQSGLTTPNGEPLIGFKIAGPDRKFVDAKAVIEGDKIIVSSPDVKHPVAVRYAFDYFFRANLYNGDGLPASPFRTDHWPIQER